MKTAIAYLENLANKSSRDKFVPPATLSTVIKITDWVPMPKSSSCAIAMVTMRWQ